jgi:hypothetical protein
MRTQAITPISDAELDAVAAGRRTNVAVGVTQLNIGANVALLNIGLPSERPDE